MDQSCMVFDLLQMHGICCKLMCMLFIAATQFGTIWFCSQPVQRDSCLCSRCSCFNYLLLWYEFICFNSILICLVFSSLNQYAFNYAPFRFPVILIFSQIFSIFEFTKLDLIFKLLWSFKIAFIWLWRSSHVVLIWLCRAKWCTSCAFCFWGFYKSSTVPAPSYPNLLYKVFSVCFMW